MKDGKLVPYRVIERERDNEAKILKQLLNLKRKNKEDIGERPITVPDVNSLTEDSRLSECEYEYHIKKRRRQVTIDEFEHVLVPRTKKSRKQKAKRNEDNLYT